MSAWKEVRKAVHLFIKDAIKEYGLTCKRAVDRIANFGFVENRSSLSFDVIL